MRILQSALIAGAVLLSGQALANEPVATNSTPDDASTPAATQAPALEQALPVRLTAAELDRVTAGDLGLPNGMVVFEGFDNAAPGDFHPNFDRSPTAIEASGNNEGPWSAAFNSPVIDFQCSIC